jgi:hypothetical protein
MWAWRIELCDESGFVFRKTPSGQLRTLAQTEASVEVVGGF